MACLAELGELGTSADAAVGVAGVVLVGVALFEVAAEADGLAVVEETVRCWICSEVCEERHEAETEGVSNDCKYCKCIVWLWLAGGNHMSQTYDGCECTLVTCAGPIIFCSG